MLASKEEALRLLERELKIQQEQLAHAVAQHTEDVKAGHGQEAHKDEAKINALRAKIREEEQQKMAADRAAVAQDKKGVDADRKNLESYRQKFEEWAQKKQAELQERHENQLAQDLKTALELRDQEKALEAQKEQALQTQGRVEEDIQSAEDPEDEDLWDFSDDADNWIVTPEAQGAERRPG